MKNHCSCDEPYGDFICPTHNKGAMKSEDERIDEILKRVLDIWKNDYPKSDGDNGLDMDAYFTRLDESEAEAKAQIKSLLREARIDELEGIYKHAPSIERESGSWIQWQWIEYRLAQLTQDKDND